MSSPLQRVEHEIERWDHRLVRGFDAASTDMLDGLEHSMGLRLPDSYRRLLHTMNGAVFPKGRLYSAHEVSVEWKAFQSQIDPWYEADPDWPHAGQPPPNLLPIGAGSDGQIRLLDLRTAGPEVLLWQSAGRDFVTTHASAEAWILTELNQLALHYDHNGRPRPIRGRQGASIPRRSLEVHLTEEPNGSYVKLQLAHWHAQYNTPEEALFAYRAATEGTPPWAVTHFYLARWAMLTGRAEEARHAFRRALAIPIDENPLKNSFRLGYRPTAHMCLAHLYQRAGQTRKATEQFRAADVATTRYGLGDYDQTDEFQQLLEAAKTNRFTPFPAEY